MGYIVQKTTIYNIVCNICYIKLVVIGYIVQKTTIYNIICNICYIKLVL